MSVPSSDLNPVVLNDPAPTPRTFTVSWSLPSKLGDGTYPDRYGLNIASDSGFTDMLFAGNIYDGGRQYAASGAEPNTRYYVRVRPHNSDGYGSYSPVTSFVTPGLPPDAPGKVSQSSRTLDGGILGWAVAFGGAWGLDVTYAVQIAPTVAFATITQTYSGLVTTSVGITGLSPGTTYFARVRATSANGVGPWSSIVAFTTLASSAYVDAGTFADHLDHLASAIADKLLHLGIYLYGVAPTASVPNNATTFVTPGPPTGEYTRGPDAPSFTGATGTNQTVQINYPGTYLVEFGFAWDRGASHGRGVQTIWVDNAWRLPGDTQKRGRNLNIDLTIEGTNDAESVVSHTVHLDQGDVLGFSAYQDTGADVLSSTTSPVGSWVRITMIGF